LQIADVEPFGEPAMDGRREVMNRCLPPMITQHLRQIAGGPKLPRPSALRPRDFEGLPVAVFRLLQAPQEQEQTGAYPIQLRIKELIACLLRPDESLLDDF
jgi:hypothetical protein